MRPLIAVTSGEPAGIGPELCLPWLAMPVRRIRSCWATATCSKRVPPPSA
jgi:4-hydroxy-L-threonine phosphate dehydrogenase PdxA